MYVAGSQGATLLACLADISGSDSEASGPAGGSGPLEHMPSAGPAGGLAGVGEEAEEGGSAAEPGGRSFKRMTSRMPLSSVQGGGAASMLGNA